MNSLPQNIQHQETEAFIDFKKVFIKLKNNWYWFIISAIVCIALSYLFVMYTAPRYLINAQVLINDESKSGGLGKQAGALMDLGGLLGSSNSVDNEAKILKTRFLMEQVVRELQLNIVYSVKNGLLVREIEESPFKLNIINSVDTITTSKISIRRIPGNKLAVSSKNFDKTVNWNETFKIKNIGSMKIEQNLAAKMTDSQYEVGVSSIDERVVDLMKQLVVGVSDKQVTVIELSLNYPLPKKGELILSTLINRYIASSIGDKNDIADNTYKFIENRLSVLGGELGDVENKVQNFKQANKLADMSEQSKILVQNTGEYATELGKAETQVTILEDLEKYLKDDTKNKRVFPTSLLPQDMVFSGIMNQYNALLIERDRQLLSVTEGSPFIKNIDEQILELRKGILGNIQSTKNTFVVTRDKLAKQINSVENQIGNVPQIEKNYLQLARNQKIKEELYIFLMQKAEESSISKTANVSAAKVIDPPKSEFKPVSPKKMVVVLAGFILGLIIPAVVFFISELTKTAVTSKDDIVALTQVPVIGEISHNTSSDNLVVANQGRSAISEQFRALRTNLSFYLNTADQKVILLTSSMSGEGKSFTAINLGLIFALAGKRVLLMELDLRKPGLSAKLNIPNTKGFSNYTIAADPIVEDYVKPLDINKNIFIMSSGPLPPNPAETLMSARTAQLFSALKEKFDYIIVDAPPVGIITDAQLLASYADVTLYLVRQMVTQKSQLAIVEDLHQNKKMQNLGIVVNDILSKSYGYGYGYGNYGDIQPLTAFQKLKNIFSKS